MSLAALIAFLKANEGLVATILFIISEAWGATPKVKSNGILSFILMQVQKFLKDNGANDPTP
jgi:hypothetical protein